MRFTALGQDQLSCTMLLTFAKQANPAVMPTNLLAVSVYQRRRLFLAIDYICLRELLRAGSRIESRWRSPFYVGV